jgi:folate-binding protein YgfZ
MTRAMSDAPPPDRVPAAGRPGGEDLAAEHRFVRESAGVLGRTRRGMLLVRGEPGGPASAALDVLQRILSSDVRALSPGAGQLSCLLSPKGKVIAAFHLYRTGADEFLAVTGEEPRPEAAGALSRYATFSSVEVRALDAEREVISIQGPRAGPVVGSVLGLPGLPGEPFRRAVLDFRGAEVAARRAGDSPEGGFELEVPAPLAAEAWSALAEGARAAGGGVVGAAAAEVLRIEAGIPRWGREVDETRFPNECGLAGALSYEKGCYIGQEVIARMRTYGHLNRRLMAVRFPDARDVPAGSDLFRDGKEVGRVTSAAVSPRDGKTVALAYLAQKAWDPGTAVSLAADSGEDPGEVVERPPVMI